MQQGMPRAYPWLVSMPNAGRGAWRRDMVNRPRQLAALDAKHPEQSAPGVIAAR